MEWCPEETDGFVPKHPFVPEFNEESGVIFVNFAEKIIEESVFSTALQHCPAALVYSIALQHWSIALLYSTAL